MQTAEPCYNIAHLGHLELLTNKPQESLDLLASIVGLTESVPEGERPALKNQAQRNHSRGAKVRRLDHFNLLAGDVGAISDFIPKALGSRITEQIVLDNGQVAASWFTVNNKSYDVAYTRDAAG